jgi:formylmethanofuran dehydrogenase subunit E
MDKNETLDKNGFHSECYYGPEHRMLDDENIDYDSKDDYDPQMQDLAQDSQCLSCGEELTDKQLEAGGKVCQYCFENPKDEV